MSWPSAARGLRSRTSSPCTRTSPASGRSAPASRRASSVRPEPSSPARPTTSPGYTSRSNGSTEPAATQADGLQVRRGALALGDAAARGLLELLEDLQRGADHLGDQLHPRQLGRAVLPDQLPVAQDRHPVAHGVDLLEEVRDEEDRHAAVAQGPHDREQLGHLLGVQARGRLVEDEQARVHGHGAGDGHQLLDREGVRRQRRRGVDVQAERAQVLAGPGAGGAPVDDRAPADLVAEHDVLGHREVLAEVDLLVHGADAGRLGLGGPREGQLLAGDPDGAGVHAVDAGQRLDERRLAGAVLPHQGVDLARAQREGDVLQRLDARERDGDPAHLHDGLRRGRGGRGGGAGRRRHVCLPGPAGRPGAVGW